jgi:hypothetical protein
MSNEIFVILFPAIGLLILFPLLWDPTAFTVLRQKRGSASLIVSTIAFSFLAELVVAAGLAFFADRIGLLNPAGYILAIAFVVGVSGAIALHLFWRSTANPPPNPTNKQKSSASIS